VFPIRWLAALTLLSAGFQAAGWCAGPARVPPPEFFIAVQGDRVTARLERASLRQVLAELRRQSGVQAQFADPVDDGTVWKTFADVPLIDALYRLLEGRSFALYYDAASTAAAASEQHALFVRILPPPAGVPGADSRSAEVPGQQVPIMQPPPAEVSADPAAPSTAANPEKSPLAGATLDQLGHAMVDPDERVRARAQEMFDQTLTKQNQPAANMPTSRR
jgi:hypothetical protein